MCVCLDYFHDGGLGVRALEQLLFKSRDKPVSLSGICCSEKYSAESEALRALVHLLFSPHLWSFTELKYVSLLRLLENILKLEGELQTTPRTQMITNP